MEDMEDTRKIYIHEEEVWGLWVSMGNRRIESNGKDEGKEESMNLVENIKSLQKYFQSYKDDNERLMKSKEQ
jgi:hypothetical protein